MDAQIKCFGASLEKLGHRPRALRPTCVFYRFQSNCTFANRAQMDAQIKCFGASLEKLGHRPRALRPTCVFYRF